MNEWTLIPAALFLYGIIKLQRDDAVFVPLPMGTVRKMLDLADISDDDVLYDLGSGDGRVIIEAAKEYGVRAVGVERWGLMYIISNLRIKLNRLGDRVEVIKNDIFDEDYKDADVVTMYLSPRLAEELNPKFEKELKKGAKVVSAAHEIPGWVPVKQIKTGHFHTYLYEI